MSIESYRLKKNVIANYFGQAYMALVGIAIMPLYLKHLGAEAYGLVGFFVMLQAWLNLLDIGLSPTLGRQVAYARGQNNGFHDFIKLLRSFEIIFAVLAILTMLIIYNFSDWIASDWIISESLEHDVVASCVAMMGFMIGLRWYAALYKSGINGLEDQVWLNKLNIGIATGKFVGALALFSFVTTDIFYFFLYQMFIGIIELTMVVIRFYRKIPRLEGPFKIEFDWMSVKSVAPFALAIAYTSGIWIVISKVDKLILSGILPISEYGYFTLVSIAAGSIAMLSSPISQSILPRMTTLLSKGAKHEMVRLYRNASQMITVASISIAVVMAIFSEQFLLAWTSNAEVAKWGKDVLFWFALGNGVLALEAFQYHLQNAFGQLRLHVIGSTISAAIQIPLIFYAATQYGAVGAGIAWFSIRTVSFLLWTPIIHRKFLPNFHLKWILKDISPIIFTAITVVYLMPYAIPFPEAGPIASLLILGGIGTLTLLLTSVASPYIRGVIKEKVS